MHLVAITSTYRPACGAVSPADFCAFDSMRRGTLPHTLAQRWEHTLGAHAGHTCCPKAAPSCPCHKWQTCVGLRPGALFGKVPMPRCVVFLLVPGDKLGPYPEISHAASRNTLFTRLWHPARVCRADSAGVCPGLSRKYASSPCKLYRLCY